MVYEVETIKRQAKLKGPSVQGKGREKGKEGEGWKGEGGKGKKEGGKGRRRSPQRKFVHRSLGWRRGSVVRTSVCSWRTFPELRLIYV